MTQWWEFLLGGPGEAEPAGEPGGSVVAGLPGAEDALAGVSDLDGDGVADHATVVDVQGRPFVFVAGPADGAVPADGEWQDVGNLMSDEVGPPDTPESGTPPVSGPVRNRRWFWVSGP